MQHPPQAPGSHLAIMHEIMQCYIDHNPDKFDRCKPFLLDLHTLIEDYKSLLATIYEHEMKQSLLMPIMAKNSMN